MLNVSHYKNVPVSTTVIVTDVKLSHSDMGFQHFFTITIAARVIVTSEKS